MDAARHAAVKQAHRIQLKTLVKAGFVAAVAVVGLLIWLADLTAGGGHPAVSDTSPRRPGKRLPPPHPRDRPAQLPLDGSGPPGLPAG